MNLTLTVTKKLPTADSKTLLKQAAMGNDTAPDCLAVLIDHQGNIVANPDSTSKGYGLKGYNARIQALIAATAFSGKAGTVVADFALMPDKKAPLPLLLVGVGDVDKLNASTLQKVAAALYQHSYKLSASVAIAIGDGCTDAQIQQFALALLNASYRFDAYKSEQTPVKLTEVVLLSNTITQAALDYAAAVYSGQSLARDMGNEPGNICFPGYLADQARDLAKTYPDLLKVTVLGEKEMAALGMGCFLAVAQGSAQEGQLVLMEYQGRSKFAADSGASFDEVLGKKVQAVVNKLPTKTDGKLSQLLKGKGLKGKKLKASAATAAPAANATDPLAPIVLVGKGVTFDSGGISLKPGAGMEEMKFDMGGGASVLGTIKALCAARLPINVVGALACAENMPSGAATRPGDVVTAMNGTTVEILNTDAEGRLVLADTLCYVQRYQPQAIIDVATLTGACVIALGHVRSALFSNDEDVLFALENASEQTGDLIWHMPLDDAYQAQLDSSIADLQNIGGRAAGAITAACFLSRFIAQGQAWAHLDIAGTAWKSGKDKDATGRPVPLFMQYLKDMAQQ